MTLPRALTLSILIHVLAVGASLLGTPSQETGPVGRRATSGVTRITISLGTVTARSPNERMAEETSRSSVAATAPISAAPDAPTAKGVGLLSITGTEYYPTRELTRRPQPITLTDLDSPDVRPWIASGKLVLMLWIDPRGTVADVTVESTDLPDVFVRAAIQSFKQSRFQPGERDGLPVGSIMRLEVSYDDGRLPAGDRGTLSSPAPSATETPSSPASR